MNYQSSIAVRGKIVGNSVVTDGPLPIQPTRKFTKEEISKIENMGIICFSSKNNEMLLWSHYADEHRGFVLEFDVPDEILKILHKCFVEVSYEPAEYVSHHEHHIDATRYKNKAWSYEKEYRYLVMEGDKLYDWESLKNGWFTNFTGVIFGNRMSKSSINAISKVAKDICPGVHLMAAELDAEEFKLNIVSFSEKELV